MFGKHWWTCFSKEKDEKCHSLRIFIAFCSLFVGFDTTFDVVLRQIRSWKKVELQVCEVGGRWFGSQVWDTKSGGLPGNHLLVNKHQQIYRELTWTNNVASWNPKTWPTRNTMLNHFGSFWLMANTKILDQKNPASTNKRVRFCCEESEVDRFAALLMYQVRKVHRTVLTALRVNTWEKCPKHLN